MATIDRKETPAKRAVDASCEIVIDALYMTSDILHSIKNNLPVPMEHAQVVLREKKIEPAQVAAPLAEVPRSSRTRKMVLAAIGVAAMTLGAIQVADAVGSADQPTAQHEAAIIFPTPLEEARGYLESGDANLALRAVEMADAQGLDSADLREAHIQSLMALDRHAEARTVALKAVADGHGPEFVTHYRATLESDPVFAAPTLLTADELTDIRVSGDRARVKLDGINYTIDVARPEDNSWASQVSAARLCAVMACAFDVPRVEHRLLDRATARQLGFDAETLDWRYADDLEVADVALTESVDSATGFPIEYTRTWRNLLSVTVDEAHLDAPFVATIEPLAGKRDWARRVIEQRGDVDSREFARQVGSLLAFDYLTNNYGRFERNERRFGANTEWLGGRLVSGDHRDVFNERQSRRVSDRFRWMTRMPAETATAVRLMAPELVDDKVLVGLSDRQKEVFWAQRDAFVDRVDQLEARHGRSAVLGL